jgi:monofunctional biosynthetic peptidoglycan transglycosylase
MRLKSLMAKKAVKKKASGKSKKTSGRKFQPLRWLRRQALRLLTVLIALVLVLVLLYGGVNPPTTHTIWSEKQRLGSVDQEWIPIEEVAPVMLRSVVAAEDANFCGHWGFDVNAIKAAIEGGGARGGSTISQQVVKNVFLWQGRSYVRKALEAVLTPVTELFWSKRRILEIYLNVAEFDEGVFGIEAASRHYFGVGPDALSARQAALLASILPNPKKRSASRPSAAIQRKAGRVMDGAKTIGRDGRAACFE